MNNKKAAKSMTKVRTPGGRAIPGTLSRVPMSARTKAIMPGPAIPPPTQLGMKKGGSVGGVIARDPCSL